MIVHVLVGKARPHLSAGEVAELNQALDRIARVPGVLHMTWGPDFSGRGQGFTHAAVIHLPDREALQRYLADPEHLRIVAVLNRLMPDRLVIDYDNATSGISA